MTNVPGKQGLLINSLSRQPQFGHRLGPEGTELVLAESSWRFPHFLLIRIKMGRAPKGSFDSAASSNGGAPAGKRSPSLLPTFGQCQK